MAGSSQASSIPSGLPQWSPEKIFAAVRARELALSRLLMAYVSSGLVFMLIPGTFLGVWSGAVAGTRRGAHDGTHAQDLSD